MTNSTTMGLANGKIAPAVFFNGISYRYTCGSWNLKTYSYATCDVTVMHDKSAVDRLGRNKVNVKNKPYLP